MTNLTKNSVSTTKGLGQECFESFLSTISKKEMVDYDYRDLDGELFSCIKPTLSECRAARNVWIEKKKQS
jgi:hypothetical protein